MQCPCPGIMHVLSCDRQTREPNMSMASRSLDSSLRHSPHTGALRAAEVHITWLNKARRPAAPPTAKRGPCARAQCGYALWRLGGISVAMCVVKCTQRGVPGGAPTRPAPSARATRTTASLSSRRAWSSAASRCSAAASASARASARACCTWAEGSARSAEHKHQYDKTSACLLLSSITPCPMLPHAEHMQPSRSQSVVHICCKPGSGGAAYFCTCTKSSSPA